MEANFRDDLAKRAMEAMISGGSVLCMSFWVRLKRFFGTGFGSGAYDFSPPDAPSVAERAYMYADAMIAERNKSDVKSE